MIDRQLMDYFHFDQSDLYANQNGRFSDQQRVRLTQKDQAGRKWSLGLGVFLLLVGLGGLVMAIVAGIANPDWGFRIGFGLGFGCIWPAVWGGIGYALVRSSFGKHEFRLATVRGRANIVRSEKTDSDGDRIVVHELHIGGKQFNVRGNLADVIMQGEEYILYYVDGTSDIISAEAVSPR
jgi:hypothetical protein